MQWQITPTDSDWRIARLTALAIGIHVLESVFPSPLPGIKPGLANIITLLAFALYGFNTACWVSVLRVLVGSLIIGTFLSPTFVLSFSGALASVFVLYCVSRLPRWNISVFGLAILMSLAHMVAQFGVVYLFFIPNESLFVLLPIMLTAALCFGVLNGILAQIIVGKYKLQHVNT